MTHTDFYTKWMSNHNLDFRIDLITEILDKPKIKPKEIVRINSKGELCEVKDIIPELVQLLTLIRKWTNVDSTNKTSDILNRQMVKHEYIQWAREQSLDTLLEDYLPIA